MLDAFDLHNHRGGRRGVIYQWGKTVLTLPHPGCQSGCCQGMRGPTIHVYMRDYQDIVVSKQGAASR